MVNYKMTFSVADAARILNVEKEVIKDWTYFFADYMSESANPQKGIAREFKVEDIRVMAYALTLWEEHPDIENIKMGLNSNNHFEDETIDHLLIEITPFFTELPDSINETWKHGVLFSGLAEFADTFYLANSYKCAGDKLVDFALKEKEPWELFCPIVYNYRHATELYLKAITGHYQARHNLMRLFNRFQTLIKRDFNETIPDWFKNIVVVFNDFDPNSTTFRYGGNVNTGETFVDFRQLKALMGMMGTVFRKIRMHHGMPDAVL